MSDLATFFASTSTPTPVNALVSWTPRPRMRKYLDAAAEQLGETLTSIIEQALTDAGATPFAPVVATMRGAQWDADVDAAIASHFAAWVAGTPVNLHLLGAVGPAGYAMELILRAVWEYTTGPNARRARPAITSALGYTPPPAPEPVVQDSLTELRQSVPRGQQWSRRRPGITPYVPARLVLAAAYAAITAKDTSTTRTDVYTACVEAALPNIDRRIRDLHAARQFHATVTPGERKNAAMDHVAVWAQGSRLQPLEGGYSHIAVVVGPDEVHTAVGAGLLDALRELPLPRPPEAKWDAEANAARVAAAIPAAGRRSKKSRR